MKPEQVIKYLSYMPETGKFIWNARAEGDFSDNGKRAPHHSCATWNKRYAGKPAGVISSNGYSYIAIKNRKYLAQRLAWLISHREWPNGQIDHIDGCRDNNALNNLRVVTNSINQRNRRMGETNTSGTTGVYWNAENKNWRARIVIDRVPICLGSFDRKEDAIVARKAAEQEHGFGPSHGMTATARQKVRAIKAQGKRE